ncbi:cystatin-C-like [Leptopilina boulardi]|uniref:cystatin-C-like n=1 Tax=Leptopilina boulardi TaxID=63433 RepID=UPI0021F55B79|nr:cystatin-C-like [Leptopilina boulardi]
MAKFLSFSFLTICILLLVKGNLSTPIIQSIPGGINRIDVYQSDILKYIDLARKEYSQTMEKTYEPVIIEVRKATTQVVRGIIYRIDLTFAASVCKTGIKNCPASFEGKVDKCTFEVWSQPWIDNGSPKYKLIC